MATSKSSALVNAQTEINRAVWAMNTSVDDSQVFQTDLHRQWYIENHIDIAIADLKEALELGYRTQRTLDLEGG